MNSTQEGILLIVLISIGSLIAFGPVTIAQSWPIIIGFGALLGIYLGALHLGYMHKKHKSAGKE